jgi:Putative beta-barrel porin 2
LSNFAGETLLLRAQLRPSRAILCAGCFAEFCGALAANAHAQTVSLVPGAAAQLAPPPAIAGRIYQPALPSRKYTALPLGSWLLYPSLSAGAFYDSNVDQVPGGTGGSFGFRFLPSLLAVNENGIEKTTVYALADGRIGSNPGPGNAQRVAANAGLIESYAPWPDLAFRAQGDYLRQRDLFSSFAVNRSVGYLNPTGIGLAPTTAPQSYNQLTASLSVEKTFYRAFAGLDASVVDLVYDRSGGVAPAPSGITSTAAARGGFWITPFLYGYAQGSLDRRSYAQRALGSSGYRTIAGIGSRRVHLVRGEIYAGYQAESYRSAAIGSEGGWVFGGRADYTPLRRLDLKASLDEALGASLLAPASPSVAGTATQVTTALAEADYTFAADLEASGRAGYIRTDYAGNQRRDSAWVAGATVTYSVWLNFGVTLDYQHLGSFSNVPLQSFSRDVVTIGGTYKY